MSSIEPDDGCGLTCLPRVMAPIDELDGLWHIVDHHGTHQPGLLELDPGSTTIRVMS